MRSGVRNPQAIEASISHSVMAMLPPTSRSLEYSFWVVLMVVVSVVLNGRVC